MVGREEVFQLNHQITVLTQNNHLTIVVLRLQEHRVVLTLQLNQIIVLITALQQTLFHLQVQAIHQQLLVLFKVQTIPLVYLLVVADIVFNHQIIRHREEQVDINMERILLFQLSRALVPIIHLQQMFIKFLNHQLTVQIQLVLVESHRIQFKVLKQHWEKVHMYLQQELLSLQHICPKSKRQDHQHTTRLHHHYTKQKIKINDN